MGYPKYGLMIEEIMNGAWENSKAHGFVGISPETHMAMIHSEVSEAFEEIRTGKPDFYIVDGKPEGQAAELADVIIRICSYCKEYGISLEHAILKKMEHNKTRPFKHGGKKY